MYASMVLGDTARRGDDRVHAVQPLWLVQDFKRRGSFIPTFAKLVEEGRIATNYMLHILHPPAAS